MNQFSRHLFLQLLVVQFSSVFWYSFQLTFTIAKNDEVNWGLYQHQQILAITHEKGQEKSILYSMQEKQMSGSPKHWPSRSDKIALLQSDSANKRSIKEWIWICTMVISWKRRCSLNALLLLIKQKA